LEIIIYYRIEIDINRLQNNNHYGYAQLVSIIQFPLKTFVRIHPKEHMLCRGNFHSGNVLKLSFARIYEICIEIVRNLFNISDITWIFIMKHLYTNVIYDIIIHVYKDNSALEIL